MANQIDTDAKVIAGDDKGFGHPAICRLSTTIMLTAHINESDELEIHKSTNDGINWILKKTLSNATGSFNLIPISSTKAGLVYQKNSNEFEVWITENSGEDWTNKLDITSVAATDKAILTYDSGLTRLHILYGYSGHMYGKYSDNYGDSWTNWGSVMTSSVSPTSVDIHPINNYVYYTNAYEINPKFVWNNSTGTWVNSFDYSVSGYTYHDRNVVIDSQGNRYLSYVDRNTSTTKETIKVHRNEGSATTLFDPDSDNAIIKGSSSISVDNNDNVYVYYTKTSDGKTYYRKYDAGTTTWESEVELIGVVNNRINVEKHLLAGSGYLHFVYYKTP